MIVWKDTAFAGKQEKWLKKVKRAGLDDLESQWNHRVMHERSERVPKEVFHLFSMELSDFTVIIGKCLVWQAANWCFGSSFRRLWVCMSEFELWVDQIWAAGWVELSFQLSKQKQSKEIQKLKFLSLNLVDLRAADKLWDNIVFHVAKFWRLLTISC